MYLTGGSNLYEYEVQYTNEFVIDGPPRALHLRFKPQPEVPKYFSTFTNSRKYRYKVLQSTVSTHQTSAIDQAVDYTSTRHNVDEIAVRRCITHPRALPRTCRCLFNLDIYTLGNIFTHPRLPSHVKKKKPQTTSPSSRLKLHLLHPRSSSLLCLRRRKRRQNRRIPHIRHLDITRVIRMHAIAQITRRETRILIDDPDGGLGLVESLRPGGDGGVQLLDFRVVGADADGDDLGDLR